MEASPLPHRTQSREIPGAPPAHSLEEALEGHPAALTIWAASCELTSALFVKSTRAPCLRQGASSATQVGRG